MHEDGGDDGGVCDLMVMTNGDSVLGIDKQFCTKFFVFVIYLFFKSFLLTFLSNTVC